MTESAIDKRERNRNWLIIGAGVGVSYGFAVRLLSHFLDRDSSMVMTVAFTCFLPFAMGCVAVYFAESSEAQRVGTWLLLPWAALVGALGATLLALLEGWICIIMFLPLGMALSSLGGLTARFLKSRRTRNVSLTCVMIWPLLMMPWEGRVFYQSELREVET